MKRKTYIYWIKKNYPLVKDFYAADFIKRSSNIIIRGDDARAHVRCNTSQEL